MALVDREARPLAGRITGPVGRSLDALSRAFAIGAGLTLMAMALMSMVSILGRVVLHRPILGDYELVQVMSAVAVVLSLPFCQRVRGHIMVDFFTTSLPGRARRFLDRMANLLLSVAAFILAWRMALGLLELKANGDASMLLDIPTWYGYVAMVPAFFLLGCNALYALWDAGEDQRT